MATNQYKYMMAVIIVCGFVLTLCIVIQFLLTLVCKYKQQRKFTTMEHPQDFYESCSNGTVSS